MAGDRIQCTGCDNLILPQTALANGGLCAPCHRRAHPLRAEITPADEARFREIDVIRERLTGGCSAEAFGAMVCPVCGASLTLNVAPNHRTFHVRCANDSTHVSFHDSSEARMEWWEAHMRGGWFS